MEIKNIKDSNKLIAEFMGYPHYKKVLIDFSDCGGIYDWTDVYSKVPIKVNDYPEDEQCYLEDSFLKENYVNLMYNPKYHDSYDWLMPVVEKIETIAHPDSKFPIEFTVDGKYAASFNECGFGDYPTSFIREYGNTRLEAVYKSIIQFIKWYNGKINNN